MAHQVILSNHGWPHTSHIACKLCSNYPMSPGSPVASEMYQLLLAVSLAVLVCLPYRVVVGLCVAAHLDGQVITCCC